MKKIIYYHMGRKTQEKTIIYEKEVYKAELYDNSWSVIIMPNNILIDNYHDKKPHIHPNSEKHEEEHPIKSKTVDETYFNVIKHIDKNKGLNLKKLIKEL
jgi:hypothetical protein